jgi:YHS domain-containing protein
VNRYLLLGIALMLIARAFWRVIDGVMEGAGAQRARQGRGASASKLVRDPVCGIYVVPNAALSLTAGGSTHYFCSEECRREFSSRQSGPVR